MSTQLLITGVDASLFITIFLAVFSAMALHSLLARVCLFLSKSGTIRVTKKADHQVLGQVTGSQNSTPSMLNLKSGEVTPKA